MAEDGEDKGTNLDEERDAIRQLQSDIAWKKESLDRLLQKKVALNDELQMRIAELGDLEEKVRLEQHRGGKALESKASEQREEAINDCMRREVRQLLQSRVPVMDDNLHGATGRVEAGDKPPEETGGGETRQHDTVLVSYCSTNDDGKLDDFKATFRIDKEVTVKQLHAEACAYWGCSPKAFILCKVRENDVTEDLMNDKALATRLQDPYILPLQEEAHLHLIRRDSLEKFKIARRKMEEEAKRRQAEAVVKEIPEEGGDAGGKTLKTMKYAESGLIATEKQAEPFVEALKPWAGVYTLLKDRATEHDRRGKLVKFRDVCYFGILACMSLACIACRNSVSVFSLRQGAVECLVEGKFSESSNMAVSDFTEIRRPDQIWEWLGGTFHYQIFNENSSLREFYTPVGLMRLKQQKAGELDCQRKDLPYYVRTPCYHVHVGPDTEDQRDMIFNDNVFINMTETGLGRMPWPDPTKWEPKNIHAMEIEGSMQLAYESSGYKVDYTLAAENISTTGDTFAYDLLKYRDHWVTTQTRSLTLEVVLANYNMHGYLACTFLVEISPSGAVATAFWMYPFNVAPTYWSEVAKILDWFRGVIVFFYIALVRVYFETKRKVARGKKGLGYVFSFFGLLDESIVAIFTGLMFMRGKADPPSPHLVDGYYTYARDGMLQKHAFVMEALLFLIIAVRFATFGRILPSVFRLWKMFSKSIMMFLHFAAVVVPLTAGIVFLASAIWDPYLRKFSTFSQSFVSVMAATRNGLPVEMMYVTEKWWTIPFVVYFFFAMSAFFINTFLAITVHAFFEVELLEGSLDDGWSTDQWLDWMLWPSVYQCLTGNEPGSSMRDEVEEEEDSDLEDDDDGDD
eukprot:TRINITY_DN93058_c0_g1_i1.p1 TRINITY_DN93058_c0_g1~~TRINITY_DN93058_c0_g1_i1.p1  ORF type:complete len:855 (+),score=258.74 TRINITY_DN93058_c0_g1_i1:302-2866(+)